MKLDITLSLSTAKLPSGEFTATGGFSLGKAKASPITGLKAGTERDAIFNLLRATETSKNLLGTLEQALPLFQKLQARKGDK